MLFCKKCVKLSQKIFIFYKPIFSLKNYLLKNVVDATKLGVCLDTCHLNDSGVAISDFDTYLDDFDKLIGLSKIGRMTTLRLFYDYLSEETTTIGYDYSRSCYDYSSRNAATIVDLYWLSGESPKRAAARAANGSAPPAASLPMDCPAG